MNMDYQNLPDYTPAYVFDEAAFSARAEQVQRAFGEKTGLCFSIKANPFLLSCLPDVFDKIEVCSPGELTVCERVGADMGKVIYSGVNKGRADVARAIQNGVGTFTAESMLHLEMINEAALKAGRVAPLLLRLTAGSQFGMEADALRQIVRNRESYPGVSIVGVHFFSGTMKKKPVLIERELRKVLAFMDSVREELGFAFERLEYGTGLAVDYFSPDADDLEAERLEGVAPIIREAAEKYELTVEMGRFFAAPCGMLLTRVMDVKTNEGVNYAILDTGMHQVRYDGQIQGMQTPNILHLPAGKTTGDNQSWTLCGSLCTTADVLARGVEFDSLSIGDTLVFTRVGAYSFMEGMSIFLSRDLPAIYMKAKDGSLTQLRAPIAADPFNTPGMF